ncbi:MAG: ABC transporter substrate-binding protein [Propionibacteriaceae bacterium]
MRTDRGARSGIRIGVLLVVGLLGVSGCSTTEPTPPEPTPTSTFPSNPFTVMTTDRITEVDPAGVTSSASTLLTENVYQTLMTADPGDEYLKPDAGDCIVDTPRSYTCTLQKKLTFHNGDPVTSADVKFSIERATRLDVVGSSASLLSSLRRIETPDDYTVRFLLSRVDTQFGWALASPAAAIVDRQVYDTDTLQPMNASIIGSGPFRVQRRTAAELDLVKFDRYVGRTPARYPFVAVKTVADSATIEDAMSKQQVDVVWRGLSEAALTRFDQQIGTGEATTDGYTRRRLPGVRVHQLIWYPDSKLRAKTALRRAVSVALQDDRTSDSVVPLGITGHVPSFATGGRAAPEITWDNRITLTLGYDSAMPDGRDLANLVRSRLEDTGGMSVRLVPDDDKTDLQLVDRNAWTPTAIAWLQPYLDNPLPGSASTLAKLDTQFRATYDTTQANSLLAQLQVQAADDATVLPMTQSDEVLFSRAGVTIGDKSFGPGWQLGLWGMTRE